MVKPVTRAWLAWIDENLTRGCEIDAMVSSMEADGFDGEAARGVIAKVKTHGLHGASTLLLNEYQYERGYIDGTNQIRLSDKVVDVTFRIRQPDVVLIDGFLSADECGALIADARAKLAPSTVVNMNDGGRICHDGRTSDGMYFLRGENDLLRKIEARIAELLDIEVNRGEGIQVLHYRVGAEYRPHYDFFPESAAGSKVHLEAGGQRVATAIMYLNDVEEGGETVFPEVKLSVMPRKGSLLYFSYLNSHRQVDHATLHGGAPVISGEKWIATKWLREKEHKA